MEVTADGSSYLSDFLEDTDFRLFSRPPTPTNPTEPVLPFSQSGIQLPNEILVTIFDLLWYDAYALLACCSTCRCFKSLIEQRLRSLRERPYFLIDRSGGGNRLREDIQLLSTCARCVGHLHVSVSNQSSLPAIFSAVPFQLSTQLVHLESLTLTVDHDTSSIHPSVWPLFGRTIPRVSRLSLVNMSFPSFNNFVQFVLSFRSLSFLGLGDITTVQHQVRRTHLRRTIRWDVSINTSLCLPRYVPFMKTFAGWVHLNNITFRELHIADYPSFFEFGRQIRACTLEHAELLNINGFISSKDVLRILAAFEPPGAAQPPPSNYQPWIAHKCNCTKHKQVDHTHLLHPRINVPKFLTKFYEGCFSCCIATFGYYPIFLDSCSAEEGGGAQVNDS